MEWSKWKYMWLFVLFDLPTHTKEQRDAYRKFREFLLEDGFFQMQYSVYSRYSSSPENCDVHEKRVLYRIPEFGEVRIIRITDAQFKTMKTFHGKMELSPELAPGQLTLF